MRRMTPDLFWRKVDKSGECWLWTGSKVGIGYGKTHYEGKYWRAHRLSWKFTFGEIPDGLCVLHKCDNPACVRPDHLFLGTFDDNNKDMAKKGRSVKGDKNPRRLHPERYPIGDEHYSRTQPDRLARGKNHGCAKLTDDDVREIYRTYKNKLMNLGQLASQFHVSTFAVHCITTGKTWKHITSEINL